MWVYQIRVKRNLVPIPCFYALGWKPVFCNFFVFCQFDKKYKIRTSRLHWVRKLFFSFSALRFSFNILFLFDIMYISIVLIGWLSLKSSIKKFRCSRKRWPHKSLLPKFAISLICTLVFHLTFHMSLQYFYLKWSIIWRFAILNLLIIWSKNPIWGNGNVCVLFILLFECKMKMLN